MKEIVNKYFNILKQKALSARQLVQAEKNKYTLGYPATIFIAINSMCNLSCRMCDVGMKNKNSQFFDIMCPEDGVQLDIEVLKKLIDEVAHFKPLIAVISTEPLLYKNIIEFGRYVKSKGLKLQITTNGFLLPEFADALVDIGLDILWVSLDGPADVHNFIRGNPQSFERAISGIQKVMHLKGRQKISYPSLYINYAISNHNYSCLTGFLDAIGKYKDVLIDGMVFSHMNYVNDKMAGEHNRLFGSMYKATPSSITAADPKKVDVSVLKGQIDLVKKNKYSNISSISFGPSINTLEALQDYYFRPERIVARRECTAPWGVAQLTANGDWVVITRCFHATFGNIYKESFLQTWNGQEYNRFRNFIRKTKLTPACTRCCSVL